MKKEFVPRKGKIYLLSREERGEVCEFIKEQLRKRYIRLSKLPQTEFVFFVEKDGKNKMVQDYKYLNEQIIKNNYPLLLISDIVKNIGTKKVITKLDLQQRYNNVWIKKGDEWKAASTTIEELFEPIVMFFGLTNSPAIFQTIINKILQGLINTRKVASFIDDIIVETEEEEGHDEIIEKIVKRLVENDLYVKPEKYKWKVREIGFLVGPKGIKMEEEKIKGVLDWLTPKGVKDIQKFLRLANYYWQFIKDFVFIARSLYDLVKKDQKWDWMEKQEKTFKKLKERFTKEPVLVVLD